MRTSRLPVLPEIGARMVQLATSSAAFWTAARSAATVAAADTADASA